MKKRVLGVAFVATMLFVGTSLTMENVNADPIQVEGAVIRPVRGDTLTIEENDNCESGKRQKCTGTGNLCSKTIGWDCVPV